MSDSSLLLTAIATETPLATAATTSGTLGDGDHNADGSFIANTVGPSFQNLFADRMNNAGLASSNSHLMRCLGEAASGLCIIVQEPDP